MFELMPFERSIRSMNAFSPFRQLDEMRRSLWEAEQSVSLFRTDVQDLGEAYLLEAELPGFRKEDITVDIEDNRLTIQAQRKQEQEDEKQSYLRRERFYGSFSRSFDLNGIDSSNITASYADGVLSLKLPKEIPAAPASRRLEIQ